MIDPRDPAGPVFVAPDGSPYVDRDGPSGETLRRWQRQHDPVTRRRQEARRAWAGLATAAVVVLAAAGAGLLVVLTVWGPRGDGWNVVAGSCVGALIGTGITLGLLFSRPTRADEEATVVAVPDEVLRAPVDRPTSEQVWRWSRAVTAEAEHRRYIGYEQQFERPGDERRIRATRAAYEAEYRAYRVAAEEMGVTPRESAL